MGRFQKHLMEFVSRARRTWKRYAEFIEGKEREHALSFEASRLKPTWIMRSEVESELLSSKGMLDFKTLSRFYPYGFEFQRHLVREHRRDGTTSRIQVEIELTGVFAHGEFFRPESRCRIEPELLPRPLETGGRVLVMKDLRDWLSEVGFSDFNNPEIYPEAKALMIDLGFKGAWVVVDPRPEVFSRPLAEKLAQIVLKSSLDTADNATKKPTRLTDLES